MARTKPVGKRPIDLSWIDSLPMPRTEGWYRWLDAVERASTSARAYEASLSDPVAIAAKERSEAITAHWESVSLDRRAKLRRDPRIWGLDGGAAELAWIEDGKD